MQKLLLGAIDGQRDRGTAGAAIDVVLIPKQGQIFKFFSVTLGD